MAFNQTPPASGISDAPDARIECASPQQWIERLDLFRERFRVGIISESQFRQVMRAFQFRDPIGHTWMVGATSYQWYRWDWNQWTLSEPPAQLSATNIPVEIAMTWNRELVAPIVLDPRMRRTDSAENAVPTPQSEIRSDPVQSSVEKLPPFAGERLACPNCGETVVKGARFCPMCGRALAPEPPFPLPRRENEPPPPPYAPTKQPPGPGRPTSLPK